jgi:hypothetical protein
MKRSTSPARVLSCGALTLVLAAGACMGTAPRAVPLYPDPEHPRRDDEVGVLTGPIAIIDGKEVADLGRTFALLPGCHTFRLLRTTGDVSTGTGMGYTAPLPQVLISLDVQPAHLYTFDYIVQPFTAPDGKADMGFTDHLPDGSVTAAKMCNGTSLPTPSNVR